MDPISRQAAAKEASRAAYRAEQAILKKYDFARAAESVANAASMAKYEAKMLARRQVRQAAATARVLSKGLLNGIASLVPDSVDATEFLGGLEHHSADDYSHTRQLRHDFVRLGACAVMLDGLQVVGKLVDGKLWFSSEQRGKCASWAVHTSVRAVEVLFATFAYTWCLKQEMVVLAQWKPKQDGEQFVLFNAVTRKHTTDVLLAANNHLF